MKLLFCKSCQDVIRLNKDYKNCSCKKIGGKYIDDLNAIYFGEQAVPLGFNNHSMLKAINTQPEDGLGKDFIAFVIPKKCNSFKFIKKDNLRTLALEWWYNLPQGTFYENGSKNALCEKYYPDRTSLSLTGREIENIWKNELGITELLY